MPSERAGYFDHAYEHDIKLHDPDYNGSRRHPFCKGQRWWAKRDPVDWYTNYPDDANPYFDTNVGDSCRLLDFTIGLEYPLELEEGKRYQTRIVARVGGRDHSPYQLYGQKLARNCSTDPRYCAERTPGGDSQQLIGKSKGRTPDAAAGGRGAALVIAIPEPS